MALADRRAWTDVVLPAVSWGTFTLSTTNDIRDDLYNDVPEVSGSGYSRGGDMAELKFTNGPMASYCTVGAVETPKALRKRAKAVEKAQKATKRAREASVAASTRRRNEEADARAALVSVANDPTKGYARVWAARSILGLEG